MYENWKQTSQENILLLKEKILLKETNEMLKKELNEEVSKRKTLELEVAETNKKIMMLNSGTKDLNKILTMGRTEKTNCGLGYQGGSSAEKTVFVKGNNSGSVPTTTGKRIAKVFSGKSCYHCGKTGHIRRYCHNFNNLVRRLMAQNKCYPNHKQVSRVWIRKKDLYAQFKKTEGTKAVTFSALCSFMDTSENDKLDESEQHYKSEDKQEVTFGGGAKGISIDQKVLKVISQLKQMDQMIMGRNFSDLVNLQVQQLSDGTFVVQNSYVRNLLEQVEVCSRKSARHATNITLKLTNVEACLSLVTPKITHLETLEQMIQYVWGLWHFKNGYSTNKYEKFLSQPESELLLQLYKCWLKGHVSRTSN